MVDYNPKSWWKLIISYNKSDTFGILLPALIGIAVFTGLVAYIENDVLDMQLRNTTVVHSLVGFLLSMMLGFRTNTAYDRWWEGRKIWGSFNNNSRNLALKISSITTDKSIREQFRLLIINYVVATKDHLRGNVTLNKLMPLANYPENYLEGYEHIPNRIMQIMYMEVQQLVHNKTISDYQLLYINEELKSFTDNIGACERILKTPIPYSYSIYLKKIIFLYVMTMPFGFALDFKYWAIPIVTLVFYAFTSIELVAEEIENPFGKDANDLPIDRICKTIAQNVTEILK